MKLAMLKDKSRIIVAIDFATNTFYTKLPEIIRNVAGVKIGLPTVLSENFWEIMQQIRKSDAYILMDLKLADIPAVMMNSVNKISEMANGVIIHAFIGSSALQRMREYLDKVDMDMFLIVAMTHPGSEEFINKNCDKFLRIAKEIADGVVAPATFPEYIRRARKFLGDKIIISPGIGRQGAPYGEALKNGADFEIIGRAITLSGDPVLEIEKINMIHKEIITRAKG